ncbi:MAG: hypothetical protein KGH89_09855, partial [Thaumarchaeota archaeon]|nr:hypothetical protein [Nitrososphaerota archaeon]
RYTISSDGNHAPFFVASLDGGNTFSNPINLSQSSGDTKEPPQMAISENHVYVVYTDTIPSGSDIFFVSGTANMTLSDESGQPSVENNPSSSANIFKQILGWIKQIFHWS